jgi:hypothetical protein
MFYWLVLIHFVTAGPNAAILHVGNFRSMQSCRQDAAKSAWYDGSGTYNYVCVQANESGTSPPPS